MSTPEWKKRELDHLKGLWSEQTHSGHTHSQKMWDRIADEWDKEYKENTLRLERSKRRIAAVTDFLIQTGALNSKTSVIDIGCGPGRFVAEFAKTARMAAGLDISESMAEYGLNYCNEQGVNNVEFLVEDFKTMDPDKKGLTGKYDLVFTSITPAVGYREGFLKAFSMSKRWFFNAAFVRIEDPLLDKLNEILGTNTASRKESVGFYAMFGEMLLENYYPRIEYYTEEDTDVYELSEAVKKYADYIWGREAEEEKREELEKALAGLKDPDGLIRSQKKCVYGWMLVDKTKAGS